MKITYLLSFFSLLFSFGNAQAQCDPSPIITGDTILCPDQDGLLVTQQGFDSYQWYQRAWGGTEAEPISGANSFSMAVGQGDVLTYYSVEVTEDTCTATSPEVLLDGWAFLLPTVQTTGNYEYNPNTGTFDLCDGDTIWMQLNLPYTTNITWFRGGQPIPGETSPLLVVTEPAAYTVQGAPEVCPNFIMNLGLELVVSVIDCNTAVGPEPWADELRAFPNPVGDMLRVSLPDGPTVNDYFIHDAAGRLVRSGTPTSTYFEVEMAAMPAGVYFLQIQTETGVSVRRVVKK